MSINQLSLEISRLRIQLGAMTPGTPAYFQVQAQLQHLTQALGGARPGINSLSF
jgi:hypothetical protein